LLDSLQGWCDAAGAAAFLLQAALGGPLHNCNRHTTMALPTTTTSCDRRVQVRAETCRLNAYGACSIPRCLATSALKAEFHRKGIARAHIATHTPLTYFVTSPNSGRIHNKEKQLPLPDRPRDVWAIGIIPLHIHSTCHKLTALADSL
jgi:hypothetical protein